MRILQLIYESLNSPFGFGGAGVRAYEIYKRLKERHDIILLCMRYPGARDKEIEGLKHIFLGTENSSLTMSVIAYTISASNFVRKYGHEYDIIVENFLPSTPFFSRFLTRTPVILQIQGVMERHAFKKFNPFYSLPMYGVERIYPGLYDRFIFVSEITMKKVMAVLKKIGSKRCYLIPNGIDRDYLNFNLPEEDYVLFMSRLDIYTKGLDILLRAFVKISHDFPSLRLILAGYEFDRFKKILSLCPAELRHRIEYAGFLSGMDKLRLLAAAKVFVLPSRHESSPISIIEAAACGRPVIVSNIEELHFVKDNGFGLTFSSGSDVGLADKLRLLLEDKEKRSELGRQGRLYAGQFLWDDIASRFESLLEDLYNDKKVYR